MLTKGCSLCFWLVNVNCLCYPYMPGMSTVAPAYVYSPPIQDTTKLQMINPLTFRAQSSKRNGIWTEKAFMLAWAIYMQRRTNLLCQKSRIGDLRYPFPLSCRGDLEAGEFSLSNPPRRTAERKE